MVLDNRYLIEAPIARGGMSTVFRGTDQRLGRQVAVKVMHAEFAADPAFVSRFEFEARSVAGLKDPGLVSVYDQGIDGEHAFLVMELVRGGTLRELLRERGPMPPHAATAVSRPALAALAAAHRAGLVHRDVKPENVLISDDGDVKLADFGLVRAVAGTHATSSSVMLGTAAYLAPEQVSTGHAGPASDVYAMGVLLFEMLTGRTPFTGDTNLAVAYRRIEEDVPAPGNVIEGVPREFDQLVRRATERDPAARFQDAGQMGAALESVAGRLRLPRFRVPAPRNSAQHRSMVVPPPRQDDATTALGTGRTADGADGSTDSTTVLPAGVAAGAVGAAAAGTATASGDDDAPGPESLTPDDAGPSATRQYTAMHPRQDPPADGGYGRPPDHCPDDGPPAAADGPYGDAATRQRRRSRRSATAWAAMIAVLAILLGVAGWWFGSGRLTTVPTTTGMDKAAVLAAVRDADLDPEVRGVYSDSAPVDQVMGINPSGGTRVSRGSTVTVSVSLGRPSIPQLSGDTTVGAVLAQLKERSLKPTMGSDEYSVTIPADHVIRIDPASGTVVPVGSAVTVTASKGPPPVHIPDVAGKTPEEATKILADAHLRVGGQRTAFDPDVDGGRVSATDPARGEVVDADSRVTLVVSNAIIVPDVSGKSPSAARSALADAGIEMVDGGTTSGTDARAGTVGRTSPAAGERVDPAHARVTVYVSDTTVVPNLVGGTVGSARSTLAGLGVDARVRQLLDSDNSLVIAQSPSSGTHIRPGATVTITAVP
ncbi:Stk1 family PASTA domain-containing Ser/Thr kinase [Tomitella cavernea]